MSLKSKEKPRFLAFPHTVKFPVSPSNLKNLTASPGVERVRTPSAYFFGTFFRTSEKSAAVSRYNTRGRRSAAAFYTDEQSKITNLIHRENKPVCAA